MRFRSVRDNYVTHVLTLTDHMGFSVSSLSPRKVRGEKSMFSPGFEPVTSGLPDGVHH